MSPTGPGGTRFAIRNGSRLAYDPGTPPPSPATTIPVLFLHELLADRSAWNHVRAGLADDTRTIAPDARGHGASATLVNQRYTAGDLAMDAIAILDSEDVDEAIIVGHGFGGATAFEIARRFPARVDRLVLIEPALSAVLENDPDARAASLRRDLRTSDQNAAELAYKGLTDQALDRYLQPRWGVGWRELLTPARRGAVRRHASSLAGLLPALDTISITSAELAEIDTPMAILIGVDASELDRFVASRIVEFAGNARLASIQLGNRSNQPLDFATDELVTAISGH